MKFKGHRRWLMRGPDIPYIPDDCNAIKLPVPYVDWPMDCWTFVRNPISAGLMITPQLIARGNFVNMHNYIWGSAERAFQQEFNRLKEEHYVLPNYGSLDIEVIQDPIHGTKVFVKMDVFIADKGGQKTTPKPVEINLLQEIQKLQKAVKEREQDKNNVNILETLEELNKQDFEKGEDNGNNEESRENVEVDRAFDWQWDRGLYGWAWDERIRELAYYSERPNFLGQGYAEEYKRQCHSQGWRRFG